jgi:hypothetical protein
MAVKAAMVWEAEWDTSGTPDRLHTLKRQRMAITNQAGRYEAPKRRAIDYENALAAWPEKYLPDTQLGPNENGRPWPSKRKGEHSTQ